MDLTPDTQKNANSRFRLIAIRPLAGTAPQYCKNLKSGSIYSFYGEYTFNKGDAKDVNSEVVSIRYEPSSFDQLYRVHGRRKKYDVQVAAVVGKNGSGKSTLFELLYLAVHSIATTLNVLEPNETALNNQLDEYRQRAQVEQDVIDKLRKRLEELKRTYESVLVELFFEAEGIVHSVRFDYRAAEKVKVVRYGQGDDPGLLVPLKESAVPIDFQYFFYTIAINYSLYSLNSKIIGNWVLDLFHKNDGYQTPIVINPFRQAGKIDVNNELHLANSRLIVNLLLDETEEKEVLKGKFVKKILFRVQQDKNETLFNFNLSEVINRLVVKFNATDRIDLFSRFYTLFLRENLDRTEVMRDTRFNELVDYVLGKLIKIVHLYKRYSQFETWDDRRAETGNPAHPFPSIEYFDEYVEQLSKDHSHVTLKLRQALNTIRLGLLREEAGYTWQNDVMSIPIEELVRRVRPYASDPGDMLELVPAAYFEPEFLVAKEGVSESGLEHMSSGELQFVHTLQSIYYHLLNIESVHRSSDTALVKYRHANIMFDEVELYFHPEFQRVFLSELLNGLSRLTLEHIDGIQLVFSTHSPFILSDIPVSNTLRLAEGAIVPPHKGEQTFGANIHELLANEFFMDNGVIGEVAKEKISRTLNWLRQQANDVMEKRPPAGRGSKKLASPFFEIDKAIQYADYEQSAAYHRQVIEMIGEPVIQHQLKRMYLEFVDDDEFLNAEIERIQKLRRNNA